MSRDLPRVLSRVLLLTDRAQLPLSRSLTRTVAECIDAGLSHVVVREFDLPDERRAATVASLVALGATVISAHDLLTGAAGVHLPADRSGRKSPPERLTGPTSTVRSAALLGRSCHTRAEVAAAAAEGCDFVTLGPFAPTPSKPGYGPPLPPEEYDGHAVPVFALGGVTPANAAAARAAGAHGVAVMGAVMRSHEPAAVIRALMEAVR